MGIGMSMSLRLRQTQSLALSLRLTHAQKLLVQSKLLSIRLELLAALRDEQYKPEGECPKCGREMTPLEIIRGFNSDPRDYTTACSGCGFRFEPRLVCSGVGSKITIPFFCAAQTLDQLPGLENLSPEQFRKDHPAVYHSAIFHYGGLHMAFNKVGLTYPFESISDWQAKIKSFLGLLPDTVIAECVEKPVTAIRALRRQLGVGRYRLQATLDQVTA